MTKGELLHKHRQAIKELSEAGLISYRLLIALMISDKFKSDTWTNSRKPIKDLSRAFRYTSVHIHRIIRDLNKEA